MAGLALFSGTMAASNVKYTKAADCAMKLELRRSREYRKALDETAKQGRALTRELEAAQDLDQRLAL